MEAAIHESLHPHLDRCSPLYDQLTREAQAIANRIDPHKLPGRQIDFVISGGGWRSLYAAGVLSVLQALEAKREISIGRCAGSSGGALVAALCVLDVPAWKLIAVLKAWQGFVAEWGAVRCYLAVLPNYIKESYRTIFKALKERPDYDVASKLRGGRLRISMTCFKPWLCNLLPDDWPDMETLINAIHGSCSLPIFTAHFFGRFGGFRVLDGCLSNYVPYFTDYSHPQIVIRLSNLSSYSQWKTWSGMDLNPEEVFRQGQREFEEMINGSNDKRGRAEHSSRLFVVSANAQLKQTWWATLRRNELSPWVLGVYKAALVLIILNSVFSFANTITAYVFTTAVILIASLLLVQWGVRTHSQSNANWMR